MGSIIVALPKIEEGQKIARHLIQHGINVEAVCKDGRDVLVKANEGDNGIAIVSSRFSDMNAVELYDYLPDFYDMIVIGSNRNFDFPAGIVKLNNPFRIIELVDTVETLIAQQRRRLKKKKSVAFQRSDEEQNILDEAKKILMKANDMTEPEAYRYIQKSSMDSGVDLIETARKVLMLISH